MSKAMMNPEFTLTVCGLVLEPFAACDPLRKGTGARLGGASLFAGAVTTSAGSVRYPDTTAIICCWRPVPKVTGPPENPWLLMPSNTQNCFSLVDSAET